MVSTEIAPALSPLATVPYSVHAPKSPVSDARASVETQKSAAYRDENDTANELTGSEVPSPMTVALLVGPRTVPFNVSFSSRITERPPAAGAEWVPTVYAETAPIGTAAARTAMVTTTHLAVLGRSTLRTSLAQPRTSGRGASDPPSPGRPAR